MSADLELARALAQMLFPDRIPTQRAATSSLPAERWPELLAAAEKNKLPLLWLEPSADGWASFYASEAFRTAHTRQTRECARQRREFEPVRRALEAEGIRGMMIKSVGRAPSWPYSSDNADLLVPLSASARARALLRELGYVEVVNVEEPHKYLFRTFRAGAPLSAIHLHAFVGWGTGFMDDQSVLADARPAPDDPNVWIPAREDALLITLAHAFYEDKEVKLGDLAKVLLLLQQGALDWERIFAQAHARGWEDGLATCISLWSTLEVQLYGDTRFPAEALARARALTPNKPWGQLERQLAEQPARFPFRVPFGLSKGFYYRKVRRDTHLSAGQKALDALRHTLAGLKRRLPFRSQRPMLVTLSGIDGSGKSAHARALVRALETCEVSVRTVWSRGGSSRLTDLAIALAKPLVGKGDKAPSNGTTRAASVERKRTWLQRPLLRAGWLWLVTLDLVLRYWAQVAWPLLRGRVVISDRYTYDALVELAVLSGSERVLRSAAARVLRALTPRPRRAYLLDASPQRALARKPDETLDYLAEQAEAYRGVAPAWGLEIVNTDVDFAAASDRLVARRADRVLS